MYKREIMKRSNTTVCDTNTDVVYANALLDILERKYSMSSQPNNAIIDNSGQTQIPVNTLDMY
jgi:hypothetical protein